MYSINTLGTNAFAISSASRARKNTAVPIVGSALAHDSCLGSFGRSSPVHPSTPLTIGEIYYFERKTVLWQHGGDRLVFYDSNALV